MNVSGDSTGDMEDISFLESTPLANETSRPASPSSPPLGRLLSNLQLPDQTPLNITAELQSNYSTILTTLRDIEGDLQLIAKEATSSNQSIENNPEYPVLIEQQTENLSNLKQILTSLKALDSDKAAALENQLFFEDPEITFLYLGLLSPQPETLDPTLPIHRFNNVFCVASTAIPELPIHSNNEGIISEIGKSPIHANFVQLNGPQFIATQAPIPAARELFWRMIIDEKVDFITDLAAPNEFPGEDAMYPEIINHPLDFSAIKVTLKYTKSINDRLTISTYEIFDKINRKTQTINKIHDLKWGDFQGTTPENLIKIHAQMTIYGSLLNKKVFRCKAGVGRVGTVIIADALIRAHESGELTTDNIPTKLVEFILKGRQQRGPQFVQNASQFDTLVELCKLLTARKK